MAKTVVVDETGVVALSLEEQEAQQQERMRGVWGDDLTQKHRRRHRTRSPASRRLGSHRDGRGGRTGRPTPTRVDHANGTQLAVLGSNLDVERLEATRSRVTATLTGVAGTGVAAGSRAQTTAGAAFETLDAVVLSPSGVEVDMQAVEEGPVEAAAGTLTEIQTVINGWETITNASAAVVGRARQKDVDYRETYEVRTAHSIHRPHAGAGGGADRGAVRQAHRGGEQHGCRHHDAGVQRPRAQRAGDRCERQSDGDVQRAVENHRGMGVGTTVTALRGGTPDNGGSRQRERTAAIIVDGVAVRRAEPGTGEHGRSEGDGALNADCRRPGWWCGTCASSTSPSTSGARRMRRRSSMTWRAHRWQRTSVCCRPT